MDSIVSEIETFCEAHGLSPSKFGRLAAKDTWLVKGLKDGREPRRATIVKIRHFMATYGAQEVA